jgi:uncharacterized membrane protein (DUF485 family)
MAANIAMNDKPNATPDDAARKRRIRRNVVFLALLALAFYVGFILLTVFRN